MTTKRILTLAAVGTLAAVSTVAISLTSWLGASAVDTSAVHLHLGTDAQQFTFGTTVQNLTVGRNNCAITSAEPLIKLTSSATGGKSSPGLANYGLGVRESPSSGNGSPCAQIAGSEVLTIQPGTQLANRKFRQVRLDLEMTGDAEVTVKISNGGAPEIYTLQTGRSIDPEQTQEPGYVNTSPYLVSSSPGDEVDACASPNSSGPNSFGSDNCQWTITPSFEFNKIEVSSVDGTVSIEGGGDFPAGSDNDTLFVLGGSAPVAVNDPAGATDDPLPVQKNTATPINVLANDTDADNDPLTVAAGSVSDPPHGTAAVQANQTILYTPDTDYVGLDSFTYRAFDGTAVSNLATVRVRVCGTSTGPLPDGVTATFERLSDPDACKSNTISFDASDTSILFSPNGEGDAVQYRGTISFGPKDLTLVDDNSSPNNGAIVLSLKYDVTGGTNYAAVPWCIDPQYDDDHNVISATLPNEVDTWCIADESTGATALGPDDQQQVITTWQVYGIDDPRFQ